MIGIDPTLGPDWDDDNVAHIAEHGLRPEQVEELYYHEGPLPTLAVMNKRKYGRVTEYRYRLWGTDASGLCIEAVSRPLPGIRNRALCDRVSDGGGNQTGLLAEN